MILISLLALFVWPIPAPMPGLAFQIGLALAWCAVAVFVLWRRRRRGLWILATLPLAILAWNMISPVDSIGVIVVHSICGDAPMC